MRPYTAKTRTVTKSYSKNRKETLTRPVSSKSLRSEAESARKSQSNLAILYGEKNEKLLQYEREKELLRKRDETKAELKALLK